MKIVLQVLVDDALVGQFRIPCDSTSRSENKFDAISRDRYGDNLEEVINNLDWRDFIWTMQDYPN